MIRALFFVALLAAAALGAAWLADRPGEVSITFLGYQVETSVLVALLALAVLVFVLIAGWRLLRGLLGSPRAIARAMRERRVAKRDAAFSHGLIAAAAGDPTRAGRAASTARRLAPDAPLTHLLRAQAAQLAGDTEQAGAAFRSMLGSPETRLLGLRGLYLEARRTGDNERARRYAAEASEMAPATAWSGRALLEYQTSAHDWRGALETLDRLGNSPLAERATMKRHRAVLLTAHAMDCETDDPDQAARLAGEAHKLAPDLVPAAAVAARRASATGDVRRATKVLEATWKTQPHPDLAEIYAHARAGDSAQDRLRRVRTLVEKNSHHPEGHIALARAAIEARAWGQARSALEPLLRDRPSVRVCTLMAEIEEGEHGDRGRVREWLGRAVNAPRDPAWTSDGYVSATWLPISPVTGEIDAFRWKAPLEAIGGPAVEPEAPIHALPAIRQQSDTVEAEPPQPASQPAREAPAEEPASPSVVADDAPAPVPQPALPATDQRKTAPPQKPASASPALAVSAPAVSAPTEPAPPAEPVHRILSAEPPDPDANAEPAVKPAAAPTADVAAARDTLSLSSEPAVRQPAPAAAPVAQAATDMRPHPGKRNGHVAANGNGHSPHPTAHEDYAIDDREPRRPPDDPGVDGDTPAVVEEEKPRRFRLF